METKTERRLAEAHEEGMRVITFTHPELGVAEYVFGLWEASDALAVRTATGKPLTFFLPNEELGAANVDKDTMTILWWLARRRSGEEDLTLEEVFASLDVQGGMAWAEEGIVFTTPDDEEVPPEIVDPTL